MHFYTKLSTLLQAALLLATLLYGVYQFECATKVDFACSMIESLDTSDSFSAVDGDDVSLNNTLPSHRLGLLRVTNIQPLSHLNTYSTPLLASIYRPPRQNKSI